MFKNNHQQVLKIPNYVKQKTTVQIFLKTINKNKLNNNKRIMSKF